MNTVTAEQPLIAATAYTTTPLPRPKQLIGITGYAGVGKVTAAKALIAKGYKSVAFADAIRQEISMAWRMNFLELCRGSYAKKKVSTKLAFGACSDPYFKHYCIYGSEVLGIGRSPRELMQTWGDYRRASDQDYWIKRMELWLTQQPADVQQVVITDVRMPAEAALLRRLGGHLIRIHSYRIKNVDDHITENIHLLQPDELVINDGSIAQLHERFCSAVATFTEKA